MPYYDNKESFDLYNEDFYKGEQDGSLNSASIIVNTILEYIKPKSVIDVGCGTGAFLKAFKDNHVNTIKGIDGEWVKNNMLLIPEDNFIKADISAPFHLNSDCDSQFDLALCLEVGEHISSSKSDILIQNLVKLSNIILFSAAIPFQGGTHHINERPPKYWAKKFKTKGYECLDIIRFKLFEYPQVSSFYKQNVLLYINNSVIPKYPLLEKEIIKRKNTFPKFITFPIGLDTLSSRINKTRYYFIMTIIYPFYTISYRIFRNVLKFRLRDYL
jgi:SAM-dependent methyltransferase